MTSTPPKSVDLKGKGKEHSVEAEEQRVPVTQPVVIDETIFHMENERADWVKKEFALRDELETLETLMRERREDVMNLKETLESWRKREGVEGRLAGGQGTD